MAHVSCKSRPLEKKFLFFQNTLKYYTVLVDTLVSPGPMILVQQVTDITQPNTQLSVHEFSIVLIFLYISSMYPYFPIRCYVKRLSVITDDDTQDVSRLNLPEHYIEGPKLVSHQIQRGFDYSEVFRCQSQNLTFRVPVFVRVRG